MERNYPKFKVTKKAERSLRKGHPWVYGEEVTEQTGAYKNGDIVDVFSQADKWLGAGFVNDHSKIRVRIISRNTNDKFDGLFFARRAKYAVDYRKAVMGDDFSCCRLIFGEADGFPGLTVDLFGNVLVTELLCLGTELRKDIIYAALREVLAEYGVTVKVIYERNEAAIRQKEGLPLCKGFYTAAGLETKTDGKVIITENGIEYTVDYVNGQKTGFFLDQKYNRLAIARVAAGRKVLDCCTHTGAFALNAAKAGALHVDAVDISKDALGNARENAKKNGLEGKIEFICADLFELLTELNEKHCKDYDLIILDPPAFTKSGATLKNAYRGYKEINMKAMKLLPRGGFLATCSCSHFMTDELFRQMLTEAAADAAVTLRQVEGRKQAPDHPILWGVPETEYLKFYIFQIV